MDTEYPPNDSALNPTVGEPNNPEPQGARKTSESSHSRSRKSSSNSAGEGVRANLQDELMNYEHNQDEVDRLGQKSATFWAKPALRADQQNVETHPEENAAEMPITSANNQVEDETDAKEYHHGWGKDVIELSSNIVVPEERTEEYQVYGDGSKIVAETLEEHPAQPSQNDDAHKVEQDDIVELVIDEPKPVSKEGSEHEAEVPVADAHPELDAQTKEDNHPGMQQQQEQQKEMPQVPLPDQADDDDRQSFDMTQDPSEFIIKPMVKHPEQREEEPMAQQLPAVVDEPSGISSAAATHTNSHGQLQSNGPSGVTLTTAAPEVRRETDNIETKPQRLPEHENTNEDQLLRHEAQSDPKSIIEIKEKKQPRKEKSKGTEGDTCKCSLM